MGNTNCSFEFTKAEHLFLSAKGKDSSVEVGDVVCISHGVGVAACSVVDLGVEACSVDCFVVVGVLSHEGYVVVAACSVDCVVVVCISDEGNDVVVAACTVVA